jgi:hypothetical protein
VTDDRSSDDADVSDETDERRDRVTADLGASAALSFDTVDATDAAVHVDTVGDDPVGVELGIDLGAVRCEVVLDDAAAEAVADRLLERRAALSE